MQGYRLITSPPLTYLCKRIARPLRLSGKLDDSLWQSAPPVQLYDAITGESGRFVTTVRALYDENDLYIGFHCQDDYVWSTVTERDGPVWNEECVEVFLNPPGVAHQYYEINLSPLNVVYDCCVLNARTADKPDEKFTALTGFKTEGLRTAVHVSGELSRKGGATGWTAEYAIPHAAMIGAPHAPPQSGDIWRANFYRIDSPQAEQREHYAWSQTGRAAFHLPWRFGFLHFE